MSVLTQLFTSTYHHEPYAALSSSEAAGKVIVITGAGSGIGRATASAFAKVGAKAIILLGRRLSNLEETKQKVESALKEAGSSLIPILSNSTDVTDAGSVNAAFEKIRERFHTVDVLVNYAGYSPELKRFDEYDFEDWWRAYEVNVKGVALVARAFIRIASQGATFINVTSALAHLPPWPLTSAYTPSKLAAVRLMEFIQQENQALRVFSLQPGLIATELSAKFNGGDEDSVDLPAQFCVWLVDPKADFLKSRLVWSNWDVEEMANAEEKIIQKDLLTVGLKGLSI